MNRRDFLTRSAATTAATLAAPTLAFAADHSHHSSGNKLVDSATECVKTGELCLQHCLDMLSKGDKTMANCAATVRETIAFCEALAKAAAQKSKHLMKLAKVCIDVCKDCEAECRKHKKMEICITCADACAACIKDCEEAA